MIPTSTASAASLSLKLVLPSATTWMTSLWLLLALASTPMLPLSSASPGIGELKSSGSENSISDRDREGLVCTSEKEVCLPSNYSKFQLPNKGKQTIVSIGRFPYIYLSAK